MSMTGSVQSLVLFTSSRFDTGCEDLRVRVRVPGRLESDQGNVPDGQALLYEQGTACESRLKPAFQPYFILVLC